MQIQCVICSDLITQNAIADIIALACGHIFHGLCLRTWLERSRTCPQCRAKVTDSKQFKIYVTIAPEPEGLDVVTLTRTLDNLKYDLKLKNVECKNLAKDLELYKTRSSGLVKEVKNLEAKIVSTDQISLQLNEQRRIANNKSRELSEAKFFIESLENELKQYQTLKSMVNHGSSEFDEIAEVNSLDSSQLTFLLGTFKKDIKRLTKINEDLKKALCKCENEKLSLTKRNHDLIESESLKDKVIESLKESLAKKKIKDKSFKKKIIDKRTETDLDNTVDSIDTSLANIDSSQLLRSPEPKFKRDKQAVTDHPLHAKKQIELQTINKKENDSLLMSKPAFRITSDRLRVIGRTEAPIKRSLSTEDFHYDGMGGHSKEDRFPSGCRPTPGMIKVRKINDKKKGLTPSAFRKNK